MQASGVKTFSTTMRVNLDVLYDGLFARDLRLLKMKNDIHRRDHFITLMFICIGRSFGFFVLHWQGKSIRQGKGIRRSGAFGRAVVSDRAGKHQVDGVWPTLFNRGDQADGPPPQ